MSLLPTQADPSRPPAAIPEAELAQLGLTPGDSAEIARVASTIQTGRRASVAEFGREIAEHNTRYTDSLLSEVRNNDLGEAGAMLTKVVQLASHLDLEGVSATKSKIPVIGTLLNKIRRRASDFSAHFDTTRDQINKLMTTVGNTQTSLDSRNQQLDGMFDAVKHEHWLLGIHIAAGRLRLAEMREELDGMKANASAAPTEAMSIAELDAGVAELDKRLGDLLALQHSAMQCLPMIRLLQGNNSTLKSKFHAIREITIPAWERQFMLRVALAEQNNAVELAGRIDDTTNALLKQNAELLHRNSVESAKANQRLVIDTATLREVQATLVRTVQEVIRINEEGVKARSVAERELLTMRNDLRSRLMNAGNAKPVAIEASA